MSLGCACGTAALYIKCSELFNKNKKNTWSQIIASRFKRRGEQIRSMSEGVITSQRDGTIPIEALLRPTVPKCITCCIIPLCAAVLDRLVSVQLAVNTRRVPGRSAQPGGVERGAQLAPG